MKRRLIAGFVLLAFSLAGCELFQPSSKTTTDASTSVSTSYQTTSTTSATSATSLKTTTQKTTAQPTTHTVSDVSYETLFDDHVYKKFEIYFSEENFLQLIEDMENYHDAFGSYRDNTIQPVDVYYTDGLGQEYELHEVGFRTKGNIFSRVLPVIKEGDQIVGYQQVAFQLEFNATFDYPVNSTEYNALKQREAFDLEQLNFKNIRDMDTGVVTESVGYDLYRDAGVITSNTSYAIVYFNIEGCVVPYGLFLLQEPIDDVFVKRYFGQNNDGTIGDLYKCTWQTYGPASLNANYDPLALGVSDYNEGYRKSYALKTHENVPSPDYSSFTDFIALVNHTDVPSYYSSVSTSLQMDAFAKAMAMGFLIGSADDFRSNANNYYMYFNQGNAYYIPFDMDNALGYGWNPYNDFGISLNIDQIQPSNYWLGPPSDFVLIYNLIQDPDFLALYHEDLGQYVGVDGAFNIDRYTDEFNLVKSLYEDEILAIGHLGITTFDLNQREMKASDYFLAKRTIVVQQLNELTGA